MSKLFTNRSGYVLTGTERTTGAYMNRGADLPPGFVSYDRPKSAGRPAPQVHPVAHIARDEDVLQTLADALGGYGNLADAVRLAVNEYGRDAGADLPPGYKPYTSA